MSFVVFFEVGAELKGSQDEYLKNILPKSSESEEEIVLSFSGDIMAHDINFNMKDYNKIYEDVKDELLKDTISFGNIEMPVCDQLPLSTYPSFNVHSDYVEAAITAGFDVFSFANNHTNDHQAKGIRGTIESFAKLQKEFKTKKRMLYASGVKEKKEDEIKAVLIEKNGLKILFLAITELLNSYDSSKDLVYYSPSSSEGTRLLADKIKKMREEIPCDLFILSLHVNEPEYGRVVPKEKKERFRILAKGGADIIWANHPHVVQEWELVDIECDIPLESSKEESAQLKNPKRSKEEVDDAKTDSKKDDKIKGPLKFYKKAFFMYSCGNFISGQRRNPNYQNPNHYWEYTGDSIIMQLKFPRKTSFSLDNVKVCPIFITAYKNKDGIVVRRFSDEWISSLPKAEKKYFDKRFELMKAYLPKDQKLSD